MKHDEYEHNPKTCSDCKLGPSLGERIAAFFFCPACFLPRFIPGHKFRGCNGEYGW